MMLKRHPALKQNLSDQLQDIVCLLDELLEYFDNRMDADDGIPNAAMNFHTDLEVARDCIEGLRVNMRQAMEAV